MRTPPPRFASAFPHILAYLLLALVLGGCGYRFTGQAPADGEDPSSRLAPEYRQMALVRVENPTTEAWLEPRLRSLLRDEFNRRRLVTWTDKSKATSLLTITIKKYTRSTAVSGEADQSVKLSAGIVVVFRVTRATDGSVIWDSGEITQDESYYPGDADGADQRVTDLLMRRMADLMTENY